ncbi:hypothetical protein GF376_02010, partial [Candidatus Peregrinibacteria bacterium]|nr:hypothetical protein [Candidatus Peregrinibacteria bacterium]
MSGPSQTPREFRPIEKDFSENEKVISRIKSREQRRKFAAERAKMKIASARQEGQEKSSAEETFAIELMKIDIKPRSAEFHDLIHENKDLLEMYTEIYDLSIQPEFFKSKFFTNEKGWLDQYKKNVQEDEEYDQTLTEYVTEKLIQEMDYARLDILEARSVDLAYDLYSDLDEPKISEKRKEIYNSTDRFFVDNKDKLAEFLEPGATINRDDFYEDFSKNYFVDYQKFDNEGDQEKKVAIRRYFDSVFDDYIEMQFAIFDLTREKNAVVSKMIDLAYSDVSDQEWINQIKELKKKLLEEEKLAKEEDEEYEKSVVPYEDLSDQELEELDLNVDNLDKDSHVSFTSHGNGRYTVNYRGGWKTSMRIEFVEDEKGERKKKYVFEDPYQDRETAVVDPDNLGKKLMTVYLDRVMNWEIMKGRDYTGPDINTFLKDSQMVDIADRLFFPRGIDSVKINEKN